MFNAQYADVEHSGGVNKYACKYIGKIDENNYDIVVVEVSNSGLLITMATLLHNTNFSPSNVNLDKYCDNERDINHDQGIEIRKSDILRVMLKYPKVMTYLFFVTIPTMSPDLHYSGIDINIFGGENNTGDGSQVGVLSDAIQRRLSIVQWRQHQKCNLIVGRH